MALAIGLTALALTPSPAVAAAATPSVSTADLRAEVDRVTAELTEATTRLEQGQAQLARVQARSAAARTEADRATALAQAARARLGEMVSAQYRNPLPSPAQLAVSGSPAALGEAVHGLAELDKVRGSKQQVLAEADGQRKAAQQLMDEVDTLQADAARQERELAEQVAGLQRRAQDANDRFNAAAAAAAAQEAAQEEREQAAARASRERAAAQSAQAAPAAPPVPLAPLAAGGACGGGNLSGYPNGMLPTSALCPLDGTSGLVLRADAAAAFNRMAAAGGMPCAGNSYRSYSQQVSLYAQKPSLAAVPGTSNHGWGVAIDFACGADSFGSAAYAWLRANGPTYGWNHPSWAQAGGSRPEPWHWEYTG